MRGGVIYTMRLSPVSRQQAGKVSSLSLRQVGQSLWA
jgi:hypothetical protein